MRNYPESNTTRRSRMPLLAVFSLLFAFALLAGCQKAIVAPPMHSGAEQQYMTLPEQAFAAYSNGDFKRAEALYDRTLQLPQLSQEETLEAWKYFSLSTVANEKYNLGIEALEKWRSLDADAENTSEWLNAFSKCMLNLPRQKAVDTLQALSADSVRSRAVRTEATLLLASREWTDGEDPHAAMQTLSDLYEQASKSSDAKAYKGTL
ncbi:MAG: hypothetical protein ACK5JO_00065 [Halodesulfovibrio sp.]